MTTKSTPRTRPATFGAFFNGSSNPLMSNTDRAALERAAAIAAAAAGSTFEIRPLRRLGA